MSETTEKEAAEAIPSASPELPAKKTRGWPKGKKRGPKVAADGSEEVAPKKAKKESARMPIPPVWNQVIADLPYNAAPFITMRTGIPLKLPKLSGGGNMEITEANVLAMYESGRAAFDEWTRSFGGLMVPPWLAYFGSVLATMGMSMYLGIQDLKIKAMELEIAKARGITTRPGENTPADNVIPMNGAAHSQPAVEELPPPTIV